MGVLHQLGDLRDHEDENQIEEEFDRGDVGGFLARGGGHDPSSGCSRPKPDVHDIFRIVPAGASWALYDYIVHGMLLELPRSVPKFPGSRSRHAWRSP